MDVTDLLQPDPCVIDGMPETIGTQMSLGLQHVGQENVDKQCCFSILECQR